MLEEDLRQHREVNAERLIRSTNDAPHENKLRGVISMIDYLLQLRELVESWQRS